MAKSHEIPGQLGLPEDGNLVSPSFHPESLRAEAELDLPKMAAAARRELDEPTDVWHDTGGGDREKIRLIGMAKELENDRKVFDEVAEHYSPTNGDAAIVLRNGLLQIEFMAKMGKGYTPAQHIRSLHERLKATGGAKDAMGTQFVAAEFHSGLNKLRNALLRQDQWDDFLADKDQQRSKIWKNPAAEAALVDGIKHAREVIELLKPRNVSTDKFLEKLQDQIIHVFTGRKLPGPTKRERARANARTARTKEALKKAGFPGSLITW